MKKAGILVAVFFLFTTMSVCGQDNPAASPDLMGTWANHQINAKIDFDAASYEWTIGSRILSGSYRVEGKNLMLEFQGKWTTYGYQIKGNQLLLVNSGGATMSFNKIAAKAIPEGFSGIMGTWINHQINTQIEFKATRYQWTLMNRTFSGSYKVEGKSLMLEFQGKWTTYGYQIKGNQLLLINAGGKALSFTKKAAKPKPKGPSPLVGSWINYPYKTKIEFHAARYKWTIGNRILSGNYRVKEKGLSLEFQGKWTTYGYQIKGNQLLLMNSMGKVLPFAKIETKTKPTTPPAGNLNIPPQLMGRWGNATAMSGLRDPSTGSWELGTRSGNAIILSPEGTYTRFAQTRISVGLGSGSDVFSNGLFRVRGNQIIFYPKKISGITIFNGVKKPYHPSSSSEVYRPQVQTWSIINRNGREVLVLNGMDYPRQSKTP